jgi:23S rRNA (pseudouridine1915-N3)-methyltransferase
VRALVPARGWLIAFDERGEALDSISFSGLLSKSADEGVTTLVLAIGGPYGHADGLRAEARRLVRLSDLVLNHEVARVVALEQVYRACTIRAGEPYHHG